MLEDSIVLINKGEIDTAPSGSVTVARCKNG